MSEKRWTDDERSEAFERGLKTMEGVALEIYRRGREPLLEELEEARARNADMRAMLEQVSRERDEWRDKFHALNQTAGELCNACGWAFKIPGESCRCEVVKERDEARAELSKLRKDYDSVLEANVGLLDGAPYVDARAAFRRGAEAMREACAEACWSVPPDTHPSDCAFAVNALPIPEEP